MKLSTAIAIAAIWLAVAACTPDPHAPLCVKGHDVMVKGVQDANADDHTVMVCDEWRAR